MKKITLSLRERLMWQVALTVPFGVGLWIWGLAQAPTILLALAGLFVLHEPLHVAGYALAGRRAQLTLLRGGLPTIAVRVIEPLPVGRYRVGLLAPAAWMLATCFVGLSLGQNGWVIAGLGGLASTSSDLALAWKTRSVQGIVQDHPTDLGPLTG
ncbi:MAG: hypothetical protein JNL73_13885 [Anaerolineales bacterium]|nr:hypothetical protein [Anaerolineales bacterium]